MSNNDNANSETELLRMIAVHENEINKAKNMIAFRENEINKIKQKLIKKKKIPIINSSFPNHIQIQTQLSNYKSCLYLSLTILQNAYINGDDFNHPTKFVGCFKFGLSSVKNSSVFKRLDEQINNYNVVLIIPILVIQCNNVTNAESELKQLLKKYKLEIICSTVAKTASPREMFIIDNRVINEILNFDFHDSISVLYNVGFDLNCKRLVNFQKEHNQEITFCSDVNCGLDATNKSNLTRLRKLVI